MREGSFSCKELKAKAKYFMLQPSVTTFSRWCAFTIIPFEYQSLA